MSSPTGGGYVDPATGQFVPGSFADQLDLPGPQGTDTAAAQAALGNVNRAKAQSRVAGRNATLAQRRAANLEKQLGKKGLSLGARKALQAQLRAQQAIATQQGKIQATAQKSVAGLQNKYYEASGQYEKLLTGENRDAYASLQSLFNGYGLGSLAGKIYEYAKQGYGADVISLLLQGTKEYKERFSANDVRRQQGLPVLSPAEYLATEDAYRQVMQDAGLPKGFYDNPADFRNWIASDTSPTEIKGRVDIAVANTSQANPDALKALQDLYGIDKSYITAWSLDQKTALPLLQKQSQAAQYGAEALKRGLTLDRATLEDFVTAGLSLSQVSSGYQAVAEALPNIQAIAARYGESFTQREAEQDLIAGDNSASLKEAPTNKRKRLASQERALFGGFSGATPGGLSTGYQAT
jgi:hypothetical protein